MIWKIKMREAFQTKRSARIIAVLTGAVIAAVAAGYLFFHNPHKYPLPCLFHIITGLYCPGCGAGRASYSILHGRFYMAFRYNPMYVTVLTGGNHVDEKINPKILYAVLILVMAFGIIRNIPVYPFTLLVPAGY